MIWFEASQLLRYLPFMSADLPSTDGVKIDLVAMRNWHFHCGMDPDRQPEMRRWHRRQAQIIADKLNEMEGARMPLAKIIVIEFLAETYRKQLHMHAHFGGPWDWNEACRLAKDAIEARRSKE